MIESNTKSYSEALKSSFLIGVSSVLEIGFRIIRAKAFALLVGPSGIGLLGLYSTISEFVRNLAGLGLNTSGVRQIAEAVGTGDAQRIARTATALRRLAFCSGILGALLLLAGSRWVSYLAFGNYNHVGEIALLSLAVFLGDIADAQGALVQGMRRISDLARINVLGAFFGTVFGIAIVYFFGEAGLVPSLLCVGLMSISTSWWYARKIVIEPVQMTLRQTVAESSGLLKMGLAFMASGLMLMGSAFLTRVIVMREINVEAAGFYQAAWAVGGLYSTVILKSMSADFYPRLTASANNNGECNRLANEQAEVVLLLTTPGVLATLVLAPIVISVFYSPKFEPAVDILRWICLGMSLKIGAWSMGFIVLAKGKQTIFFWLELLSNLFLVGLVWLGVRFFGLVGTGMGFFGMYFLYFIATFLVVRRLSGFRWSEENRRLIFMFLPLLIAVFVGERVLPHAISMIVGLLVTLFVGIFSVKTLCTLVPAERFHRTLYKFLVFFRLMPQKNHLGAGPQ